MITRLRQLLTPGPGHHNPTSRRVAAAVLLPLYYKQGEYHLLFTQRTETVREHKGQISFPGGAYEEGDRTLLDTALRECAEEIGLSPQDVEVLGALDDECSLTTNYIISPFVGLIPWPYHFQINKDEIAEIIEIPLSQLLKSDYLPGEFWTPDGEPVISHFYQYHGKVIWGATARILNNFLAICAKAMEPG